MYRDDPRLSRIEEKLDRCIEAWASSQIHAAVCDNERRELAKGVKTANGRIWKIALALVALSAGSAAGIQAVQALF